MNAESSYEHARDLDDQLTIAIARGTDTPDLAPRAATANSRPATRSRRTPCKIRGCTRDCAPG